MKDIYIFLDKQTSKILAYFDKHKRQARIFIVPISIAISIAIIIFATSTL